MILYHGSNVVIRQIDLEKSKPYKDFGKGFYLLDNEEQAHEMAVFKSVQFGGNPVVSLFEFDKSLIESTLLSVKLFHDYSAEWADFVLANRDGLSVEWYDFIYGPIANDKVGLQIRKLKDGAIDKKEFLERLKYMKGITFQYFFGSEEALKFLKKI